MAILCNCFAQPPHQMPIYQHSKSCGDLKYRYPWEILNSSCMCRVICVTLVIEIGCCLRRLCPLSLAAPMLATASPLTFAMATHFPASNPALKTHLFQETVGNADIVRLPTVLKEYLPATMSRLSPVLSRRLKTWGSAKYSLGLVYQGSIKSCPHVGKYI